jgi:hypothetical protein
MLFDIINMLQYCCKLVTSQLNFRFVRKLLYCILRLRPQSLSPNFTTRFSSIEQFLQLQIYPYHIAGPSYFPRLVISAGRAKYDLDVAGAVIAAKQLGQSVPGDDRRFDIEQNEVGLICRSQSHDTQSAWRGDNFNHFIA